MRRKMIGVLAIVALCGTFFVLNAVGATGVEESAKEPTLAVTGGLDDGVQPFPFPERAYCESDCCYASCSGAPDCSVSCSSSGCSAQGGGQSASYTCDAQIQPQ